MPFSSAAQSLALLLRFNIHFLDGFMVNFEMVLRMFHLFAGITWIGLLYFFNFVSFPVMEKLEPPVRARLLSVLLPKALSWFRWGAVVTVVAGMIYFMLDLRDSAVRAGDGLAWVKWFGVWLVIWAAAWVLERFALKHLSSAWLRGGVILAIVAAAGWTTLRTFAHPEISTESLAIGIGGGIGFLLLLNVWGIVWPAQKRLMAWNRTFVETGAPPPPAAATLRLLVFRTARASAWLTIPMLFFMGAADHFVDMWKQ